MRLLPLLFALLFLAVPASGQLRLEAFPKDGQLYPRTVQNTALVAIAGAVTEGGWDELVLRVGTRDRVVDRQTLPLRYANGEARFATSTRLLAGLRDYGFELRLRAAGAEKIVAQAKSVVCGDAFLICGQSNAVALDYWDEQLANLEQSWWVRSYGTQSIWSQAVRDDDRWYRAEGERQRISGAVGSWGLALGAKLVREAGVPVAIINGAVGGVPISYHQRNDNARLDLSTAYGRMLWRSGHAGLHQHVRGLFWYQGESDGGSPGFYQQRFANLMDDWREDYPSLEKVYVMQVRQGCGVNSASKIYEIQRELPLLHSEVQLMSTTALPGHDGCHFFYAGYDLLADHLSRQVARDFYGKPYGPAVDPPSALIAQFVNGARDRVRIEFDLAGAGLLAQAGCESSFLFEDGAQVTRASTQGRFLELQLDRATTSATLRFVGKVGGASGFVVNRLGVGALAFELPLP